MTDEIQTTAPDPGFVRGVAFAIRVMFHNHGTESARRDLLSSTGITPEMVLASGGTEDDALYVRKAEND